MGKCPSQRVGETGGKIRALPIHIYQLPKINSNYAKEQPIFFKGLLKLTLSKFSNNKCLLTNLFLIIQPSGLKSKFAISSSYFPFSQIIHHVLLLKDLAHQKEIWTFYFDSVSMAPA